MSGFRDEMNSSYYRDQISTQNMGSNYKNDRSVEDFTGKSSNTGIIGQKPITEFPDNLNNGRFKMQPVSK
jgi:hypothetical protein